MKLAVTGAAGFIGMTLCRHFAAIGHETIAVVRTDDSRATVLRDLGVAVEVLGPLSAQTVLRTCLAGLDAVVYLAGRAHILADSHPDPLSAFQEVNRDATLHFAREAIETGVRRFVFVSSIGVNGNETGGTPFTEAMPASPHDLYAISKFEAEEELRALAQQSGMELVILRPPLVYGPGAPGNFGRLIRLVSKDLPLPLGAIANQRSLLYLGNLVDAIRLCLEHPAAANKTYLLSDGEDVSTPELVRRLARAMGRPACLLPVPPSWFALAGRLMGKQKEVERLLGSLLVDSSAIRRELGWVPPYTLDEGLRLTVRSAEEILNGA